MKHIDTLLQIVQDNLENRRPRYDGLSSSEIGAVNRYYMFGKNDEAFPEEEEWSAVVN